MHTEPPVEGVLLLSLMRAILPTETKKQRRRCATAVRAMRQAVKPPEAANDPPKPQTEAVAVLRRYCEFCGRCRQAEGDT